MGKYRALIDIEKSGKRFKVFENKYHKKYFLRILDDNSLLYPTIEEYTELDRIYNVKSSNRKSAKSKIFNIEPKVIFRKKLLPLVVISSMALAGCAENEAYQNDLELEEFTESVDLEEIAKSQGIELSKTKSGLYYITKMDNGDGTNTIFVKNNDEFRNYVDVKEPTFDELRRALSENEKVPKIYKDCINQYIDSLEKEYKNIDLVVMYYNMQRLTITEKSPEEIQKDMGEVATAYFLSSTGEMIVSNEYWNEIKEYNVEHEVSHMLTEAEVTDEKGNKIVRSYAINLANPIYGENGEETLEGIQFGNGDKEAITEIVTQKVNKKVPISAYNELQDEYNLFASTMDLNIYTALADDVTYLSDKMYKNKVEEGDNLIGLQDEYYYSAIN